MECDLHTEQDSHCDVCCWEQRMEGQPANPVQTTRGRLQTAEPLHQALGLRQANSGLQNIAWQQQQNAYARALGSAMSQDLLQRLADTIFTPSPLFCSIRGIS